MVFDVGVNVIFKRAKTTQEIKKELKGELEEIKNTELEAKISYINVVTQVLHEDIKELVEEMKMLIIPQ